MLTPKCHAEIAGEGVEYMWTCSKGAYRNLTLKEKRGKENLLQVWDTVCQRKSFQSNAFGNLQNEHDSIFLLTMLLTVAKSAEILQDYAKQYGPLEWRSCLATSRRIDVWWTPITSSWWILISIHHPVDVL
jgi:hypothetical protein